MADRDAPRKQRHTARRVWQRLVAEHGAQVSERQVSRYVRERRVALGEVGEAFVPDEACEVGGSRDRRGGAVGARVGAGSDVLRA
ncbi:MAG: hypothetical protein ACR2LK_01835 [Solirubrobacteraceae bacterium]